jgi:DNA modification methylase
MCGDSTDAGSVDALMSGATADLVFTSPPYAQQRDYTTGGISDWDALMQCVFAALPVHGLTQVLVNLGLVHRDNEWNPYWERWIEWMRGEGWRRFGWYVWDQGPGLAGDWNGRLAPSHEFIFHFNREAERARKSKAKKPENIKVSATYMRAKDGSLGEKRATSPNAGLNTHKVADSVVRVMRVSGNPTASSGGSHPAMFPVALVEEMMLSFSDPCDVCYDPFGGSGTSVIAGEKNDRAVMSMDIAPEYVDVAVRRWQQFTGGQAIHDASGKTFDEVADG